jgi:Glycosyl hydrolases related to GH101 family, GH129
VFICNLPLTRLESISELTGGLMKILARLLLIFLATCAPLIANAEEKSYTLRNNHWSIRIVPAQLGLWGNPSGINREIMLASPAGAPEKIADLKTGKDKLSWRIPEKDLVVEMQLSEAELSVRFTTSREQTLEWPMTGADPTAVAAIYPESEGLYIPVDDPFWVQLMAKGNCRDTQGGISMPFWGFQFDKAAITYFLTNDLRSRLCFGNSQNRLFLKTSHEFLKRDAFPAYEVKIALTDNSPIAPAKVYRNWLIKTGGHVSWAQKLKQTPEAGKLFGAMHAYLWGDGRTKEAMEQLHQLGVERACLIYAESLDAQSRITQDTIATAKRLGYLIGPYDTLNNIQDPKTADDFPSIFDEELFRTGGIMERDGKRMTGFANRGYELSSEALRRASVPYVKQRVNSYIEAGANNYFLDSDAFGSLYDDYDPLHPMTTAIDRENKIQRMRIVSQESRLVLGSERAAAWGAPFIHFSHGTETPHLGVMYELMRQRDLFGGYYPAARPRRFFNPIIAPADFAKAVYDPRYRLPLYQVVFHDSLVSTDRWEMSLVKFSNLVQARTLLQLLYNVPSLWSLDQKTIKEDGERIKALSAFFAPLHRLVGDKPMKRFRWLTADRMVQRTQFGNEIELTANFGEQAFGNIPPRCIEARWLKGNRRQQYCPEP